MPIILPHDLTSAEIRVLQEFRRLNVDILPLETIKALKHPAGGGETPATGLVAKGFLDPNGSTDSLTLTPKAKEFLSYDPKPMVEESSGTASADEISAVEGA